MPKLKYLVKAVIGLPTKSATLNGKPLPKSVQGLKPAVVVHDGRLSAGLFQLRCYKRRNSPPLYRLAVWRMYRLKDSGEERVTTTFHVDNIEPVLDLVAKLGDRFARGS